MDFGRFKFTMVLRVVKSPEDKIEVTVEIPEQGMKGMPLGAMLYNHPDVRLEFERMGGVFNGKLSADGTEISGAFDDGPGGKAMEAKFRRSSEEDKPEPIKTYTFAVGETQDIRGYWKTSFEPVPGMVMRVGVKIGRLPDGTFRAEMDMIDQGAKDIPASTVTYTKPVAKMEWKQFQSSIDASLSDDGQSLAGEWKQGGQTKKVKLERLTKPATALPDGLSFEPDKGSQGDLPCYWKGNLETPGQTLRLKVKIGRAEDSSFAGTLISVDQGGPEFGLSSVTKKEKEVRLELKMLRALFSGEINTEGSVIEGKWEQGGGSIPLKLERSTRAEYEKKN